MCDELCSDSLPTCPECGSELEERGGLRYCLDCSYQEEIPDDLFCDAT